MIRNIIFDFGNVLLTWDPRNFYREYFHDDAKMEYFLSEICNSEWNSQMDAGKPFAQGIRELTAIHPEFAKEIQLYYDRWHIQLGTEIPGTLQLMHDLKAAGYKLYGLSNWSMETFPIAEKLHPAMFEPLEGKVISGNEGTIKPDAKIYRILLDRFCLKPEECIFLDDNQANIDAAKALGINAFQFTTAEDARIRLREILNIEL